MDFTAFSNLNARIYIYQDDTKDRVIKHMKGAIVGKTILFLAANPKDTQRLRLDEEIREIREGLRLSKGGDQIDMRQELAPRVKDLRRAMFDVEPQIVHFSGHAQENGIFLENDEGNKQLVEPEALAQHFSLFKRTTECVILNACYSEPQAEAIARHIPYVIGMVEAIGDRGAMEFAIGFYDAIGAGRSIEDAFEFGRNAIRMAGLAQYHIPVLKKSPAISISTPFANSSHSTKCTEWSEKDWNDLIHDLNHERCILMLGTDAATAEVNGQNLPLTTILARELAQELYTKNPEFAEWNIDKDNLAQVAQYYGMEFGRTALEEKVEIFYHTDHPINDEFYKELAVLPFYLAITTTCDELLPLAFHHAGKSPEIQRYHPYGKNVEIFVEPTVEHPLVFALYGTISETDSLVVTETDLLEFLVKVSANTPSLPKYLLSQLRDTNKSLLFLGFGFRQWYKRILLHILEGSNQRMRRSFALEQFMPANVEEFEQTVLFFRKSDYWIHICRHNLQEFVNELHTRYDALYPGGKQTAVALSQNKIRVWICHAPQDEHIAQRVSAHLSSAGFIGWQEHTRRASAIEFEQLKNAIQHEVEYVIILQSQAINTDDQIVDAIMHIALQRQATFPPGICFLIPARIEDGAGLEELEHLRMVDVSRNDDELITLLQRDQQKRLKGRM